MRACGVTTRRVCRSTRSAVTWAGSPTGEASQKGESGRSDTLLPIAQESDPVAQPASPTYQPLILKRMAYEPPVASQWAWIVIEFALGVQENASSSWPRSPIHALSNLSLPTVPGTVRPSRV